MIGISIIVYAFKSLSIVVQPYGIIERFIKALEKERKLYIQYVIIPFEKKKKPDLSLKLSNITGRVDRKRLSDLGLTKK